MERQLLKEIYVLHKSKIDEIIKYADYSKYNNYCQLFEKHMLVYSLIIQQGICSFDYILNIIYYYKDIRNIDYHCTESDILIKMKNRTITCINKIIGNYIIKNIKKTIESNKYFDPSNEELYTCINNLLKYIYKIDPIFYKNISFYANGELVKICYDKICIYKSFIFSCNEILKMMPLCKRHHILYMILRAIDDLLEICVNDLKKLKNADILTV